MKVYAFVPAKGTSERVENKNMRFLDGERLYIRALKKLFACKNIDKVFCFDDRVGSAFVCRKFAQNHITQSFQKNVHE